MPTANIAANQCPYLGPPLDFVYLYIHSQANGEELRFSIRSVFKNYLGPARIWVIGDKPEWYSGLHVSLPRIVCRGDRARLDRAHKFYHIATRVPDINDRFIAMQDDIYLVNPVSFFDLNRRWINDKPLTPESVANWNPKQGYAKQKKSTALKLFKNGIHYVSDYSTHTPKFYFKEDLKSVIDEYELLHTPLVCTILFDNAIRRCDPPFPIQLYRVRLKSSDHSAENLLEACKTKIFLNHLEQSWTDETRKALQTLFPEPSICETTS
jgi:hypothetical protein